MLIFWERRIIFELGNVAQKVYLCTKTAQKEFKDVHFSKSEILHRAFSRKKIMKTNFGSHFQNLHKILPKFTYSQPLQV